jgi:hypothetical protein
MRMRYLVVVAAVGLVISLAVNAAQAATRHGHELHSGSHHSDRQSDANRNRAAAADRSGAEQTHRATDARHRPAQYRRHARIAKFDRQLRSRHGVKAIQAFASADPQAAVTEPASHGGLVTIQTAAGIPITVASSAASRFQGFITDLVARGYRPRHIGCHAGSGHVANSNHYWGGACDFDQTGWGRTAGAMHSVADLAGKWGLRDGCSFRDCGHIDIPTSRVARLGSHHRGSSAGRNQHGHHTEGV